MEGMFFFAPEFLVRFHILYNVSICLYFVSLDFLQEKGKVSVVL